MLNPADWTAIGLTLKLALTTTVILLLLCTPLAWWLAHTHSRWRHVVGAVVALPLVLPPTVIGFYLLVAMGPHGPLGQWMTALGWPRLPFSFAGLVVGSLVYSLPFTVQPLQRAFEAIGPRPLEAAATLGAGPLDRFFTVAVPLRWSDMDAYGHVNNVRFFDFVAEARVHMSSEADEAGNRMSAAAEAGHLWMVVRQDLDYLAQLDHRLEPYQSRVAVAEIGRTSMTVNVGVYAERFNNQGHYIKVTEAQLTYVAIDDAGKPRPVPVQQL